MNYFELATQIVAGDPYCINEKIEYWTRYWESEKKSRKYFDLLVEIYQSMVRQIVIVKFKPNIDAFPDFMQEGNIGLIYSIQNFNPKYKSNRKSEKSKNNILFFTFAQAKIKGEIYHMLRDQYYQIRQPAWIQEIQSKLTKAEGDNIKEEEILNSCTEKTRESLQLNYQPISIDQSISNEEESGDLFVDFINKTDVLSNVIENLIFDDIFFKLTDRDKKIFELYVRGISLTEISKYINTSPSEASRLLRNIKKRIRPIFESYELIKEEKVILDSANLGLVVAM